MEKFTEMEKKVLKAHFAEANHGCGAKTMQGLINDNYSYADVKDLSKRTGYTVNQVKGVVGSLCKKGAIYPEGEGEGDYDLFLIDLSFMEEFDPDTNFLAEDFLK